jgi:ankyrin repeat protein
LLDAIGERYHHGLQDGLDQKVDIEADDTTSILSGNTLLGIQDDKAKNYSTALVDNDDEPEPTGCLFRSIFHKSGKNKTQPAKSALHAFLPTKFRNIINASEDRRNQKIAKACMDGNLPALKKLSRDGLASKYLRTNGHALLNGAARCNQADIICVLIAKGVPVDGIDASKNTPLMSAIKGNSPLAVTILLGAGADVEKTDLKGQKPIHMAINLYWEGRLIETLVKAGADIEATDKDGMRALHIAAKTGKREIVRTLLDLQADIHAPGPMLNKPIHYAVEHGEVCNLKQLVDAGADVESTNVKLCTPLHWAAKYNRPRIVEYLVGVGANLEAPKTSWETPVKYAVSYGRLEILKQLIAAGANVNASTSERKMALHSAAAHEDHQIVKTLIDGGAEVDPRGKYGSTPLWLAAQNGRIRTSQLLIEAGADLKAERRFFGSSNGRAVTNVAKKYRNWEIVNMLERAEQGLPLNEVHRDLGK